MGGLVPVTNRGHLRETARKLLEGDFATAKSLEILKEMITFRGEIQGSERTYNAEKIIKMIEQERYSEIPRIDGLRKQALKLKGKS